MSRLISTLPAKKSNATAEALGRLRGGFSTKAHTAVDALGNPLKLILRPGQRDHILEAEALAESYPFEAMTADKGFANKRIRRRRFCRLGGGPRGRSGHSVAENQRCYNGRSTRTSTRIETRLSDFSVASSITGALRPATRRPRSTTWPSCTCLNRSPATLIVNTLQPLRLSYSVFSVSSNALGAQDQVRSTELKRKILQYKP